MPPKKKAAAATITCPHCRYERPAKDKYCHLCGYPWDFTSACKSKKKKPRN